MKMKIVFFLGLVIISGFTHRACCQVSKTQSADKQKSPKNETGKNRTVLDKKLDFFVEKLRKEQFTILKSKKDIPDFIKVQMPGFNDSSLADPGEKYQEPGVEPIDSTLPGRRIVFLAKSKNIFVIAYVKGGAKASDHIALIQYKGDAAVDVLPRVGCHNCKSVKAIMRFINVDREKKKKEE